MVVVAGLLLLAACGSAPAPATAPQIVALPPTLPPRQERPPAATPTIAPPLAETAMAAAPGHQPTPTPTASGPATPVRLPGAFVSASSARLLDAPAGALLATVPAGIRLGVLGRTADSAWLQVQHQPEPGAAMQTGWVRSAEVTLFIDLAALPVAVAAAAAGDEPTAAAISPGVTATVLANRLNLRAGPGVDAAIITVLRGGEQVEVLGRTAGALWLQVQAAAGEAGWAAARWLQAAADLNTLPVTGVSTTGVPAPAAPAAAGRIVFQTHSGGDIYTIRGDGASLRRLTYGLDPALSPDGARVAFTRWDEPRGLWIIDADGSGARLLFTANRARSPTWTPDGSAIVFEHLLEEQRCRQSPYGCLTDEELRQVFGDASCIPTPFGQICIEDFPLTQRRTTGLIRYDLQDGGARDLPVFGDAQAPYHHPTAAQVLFHDRSGLGAATTAGDGAPGRLLESTGELAGAVFSPDGRYIYASYRSGDHWDIWRWRADGSQPLALTSPPPLRDRPVHSVAPAPSPDGRFLLFLTDRRGRWELWRMNSDGANAQPFAAAALGGIEFRYEFANERVASWR